MIRRFTQMFSSKLFSFEPMLCEGAERPPEGHEWRCELKLDRFHAIGLKSGRSVQLWSRNQKDFARRFSRCGEGAPTISPSMTVSLGSSLAPRRKRQTVIQSPSRV
jgi:ATP-dependent DNA ligase